MNKMNITISSFKMSKGSNIYRFLKLTGFLAVALTVSACKGQLSEKPPIHFNPNMDHQARMEAQEANDFFDDRRAMRPPVEGTVARGLLKSDVSYHEGIDESGDFIASNPIDITKSFLYRGKERYEVFCAPCHGYTGFGDGVIIGYGYVPAPSFYNERIVEMPDGEIYSAIHNGVRTMPSYRTQIAVEDRWAIVAYVRALQTSRNVNEAELQEYGGDATVLKEEYRAALEKQQEREEALAAEQAQEEETTEEPAIEEDSAATEGEDIAESQGEVSGATIEMGKQISNQNACGSCHNTDGSPGGIGPTWLDAFGSEAEVITRDGETITVTKNEEYIRESIVDPEAKKDIEYSNGFMVAYDFLSEEEIDALVAYIKSLSEN